MLAIEPLSATLITSASAATAKAAAPGIAKMISNLGQKGYERFKVKFTNIFESYNVSTLEKVSFTKNILYRNEKIDTLSQYVSVTFQCENKVITDLQLLNQVLSGKKILINGTAGAGKTMFLKWATIKAIETIQNHQLIPIFIELRDLDGFASEKPLIDMIFEKITSSRSSTSRSEFETGLKYGAFFLVFDAVDEISPLVRATALKKLSDFIYYFPDLPILITSRKNTGLEDHQELSVYQTMPMTIDQVKAVIKNARFDYKTKNQLIIELENGLFEKLKDFVSNPLLATVMMLTYDHSGNIPERMSLFYAEAFNALYSYHDTTKGGSFNRALHSGIAKDDFQKLFATFCYLTFNDARYEFSDMELRAYVSKSLNICDLKHTTELIIKDFIESVCLVQQDGLDFVFVHRSFQEYFTALFLSLYRGHNLRKVIISVCAPGSGDNVLKLLKDISPEVAEKEYVLPAIIKWLRNFQKLSKRDKFYYKKLLSMVCSGLTISDQRLQISGIHHNNNLIFLLQLDDVYRNLKFVMSLFAGHSIISGVNIPPGALDNSPIYNKKLRGPTFDDKSFFVECSGEMAWLEFTNLPTRIDYVYRTIDALRVEIQNRYKKKAEALEKAAFG